MKIHNMFRLRLLYLDSITFHNFNMALEVVGLPVRVIRFIAARDIACRGLMGIDSWLGRAYQVIIGFRAPVSLIVQDADGPMDDAQRERFPSVVFAGHRQGERNCLAVDSEP